MCGVAEQVDVELRMEDYTDRDDKTYLEDFDEDLTTLLFLLIVL